MNRKILCSAALVGGLLWGQMATVEAAQDVLMEPGTDRPKVTAMEKKFLVQAPNQEVRQAMEHYNEWFLEQSGKTVDMKGGKTVLAQRAAADAFMQYVAFRINLYIVQHRYEEDSYATTTLRRFQARLQEVSNQLIAQTEQPIDFLARLDGKELTHTPLDFLTVESDVFSEVGSSELRFYGNEVLLYAIQRTMGQR